MIPIHEIVHAIQGEGNRSGLPCTLVRTHGCNLACAWCDTDQSGVSPTPMGVEAVVERVLGIGCNLVELTGGEPLIHEESTALCNALLERGLEVLVETNGSLDVSALPRGLVRILDLKPPSSGECSSNLMSNIPLLEPIDEVKIVVAGRDDYEWARARLASELVPFSGTVHLSPLTPGMDPAALARWILRDGLEVRLNVQIHKLLSPALG